MLLPFAAKGFRVMIHIIVIIISVPIYSVQSMLVVFIDILKASYNPTLLFLIVVDYYYHHYYHCTTVFSKNKLWCNHH